ncbi:MAG: DNA polymerase III subunit delta, partial [Candidatus Riflebacteria bacterium]|nr:DNA polymerase III subunit delta [Candidatus Riflebacteria bacterium]
TLHDNGIPTNTIIVFTSSDLRISNELATKFKQQADKIDFWAPFANKLPSWIKNEVCNQGAEITSDAADLLIELIGSDLSILYQEVTKLALSHKGKIINLREVKNSVSYQKQNNVFDFLNAFTSRDIKASIKSLESLIKSGEAPQKIWFMLSKQVREMRLFHDISKDRPDLLAEIRKYLMQYSGIANKTDYRSNQDKKNILANIQEKSEEIPETIVKSLGLRNQAKIKNLYYALNFKHSELIKLWPELLKTDLALKSGVSDPTTLLTTFIHKSLSLNI